MKAIGELQPVSLTVTEAVIQAYAELSDDFNPIHVDADFAATTPMGRPIAHGTLSLCLLWQCLQRGLGADALSGLDLQVRFVKPVYVGDVVTAGGQPGEAGSGHYDVWVRGQDASDRIVGAVILNPRDPADQGDRA
ncbi:MaoC/PaaZ C-terminal domain-containing protein [Achromobacter sp.]|uniref:MaoC family dehydratase n=1 Tax=Achromobacter sp. TaxID=134375 RepID=UPI0028A8BBC3|nr:MaoC/PaaZ C-terminal domain-containing protein [Achromobacter sp.]